MNATEGGRRKLTWDEMHKAMKRVHRKTMNDSWLMGPIRRKRTYKCHKRKLAKERLKMQEEHPEEFLAKRKYWIAPSRKP